MSSVKFDENHLIIIEKVDKKFIYYKSVGTEKKEPEENGKIKLNNFFEIYNKRGILIENSKKKNGSFRDSRKNLEKIIAINYIIMLLKHIKKRRKVLNKLFSLFLLIFN
ncbi:MAG: hypothetical protein Q9M94_02190, partial [Candidatus Gracilibacteria bacterium]|nr:hypothetical protein [Candidatus Gracilibacteria bacterium]